MPMLMKNEKTYALTAMTFCWSLCLAQGPNGSYTYYQGADGKKGQALKTAMFEIIRNPDVDDYSELKADYKTTDKRSDGKIHDWYSNATSYVPGSNFSGTTKNEGEGYNREHLMPQSWYKKASPMLSDIMQVVPTDAFLNGKRSDLPFGEVTDNKSQVTASLNEYSKWGTPRAGLGVPSGVASVFEPNDDIKGDIARIYFYMATCYEDQILSWTGNNASTVIGGTKYQPLKAWVYDMMARWSKADPVDEVEIARNKAVKAIQGNRNPFVDYPGLEDYIWGDKVDKAFSYDNYVSGAEDETPVPDDDDPATQGYASISIGSTLMAAYSSDKNLDFTRQEGLTAWIATSIGEGGLTLKRVNIVPAGLGVLVIAKAEGTYDVPATAQQYCYGNLFVGLPDGGTVETSETVDGVTFVTLSLSESEDTNMPTFVPNKEAKSYGTNTMYLRLPE